MAFCTLGFALFEPMHKKQKEEDLKSFKTNEEIISTSEKNLLLSSKTPARPLNDAGPSPELVSQSAACSPTARARKAAVY